MRKVRTLFLFAAVVGSVVGASFQSAHARAAWKSFCAGKGGVAVSNPGPACFVDGIDIFSR